MDGGPITFNPAAPVSAHDIGLTPGCGETGRPVRRVAPPRERSAMPVLESWPPPEPARAGHGRRRRHRRHDGACFHDAGARVHVCDVDRGALDRLGTERARDHRQHGRRVGAGGRRPGLRRRAGGARRPRRAGQQRRHRRAHRDDRGHRRRAGWERTIAVNLNGQYYFARRAVPLLKRSRASPCVIAMGSVAGRLGLPSARRTPPANGPSSA